MSTHLRRARLRSSAWTDGESTHFRPRLSDPDSRDRADIEEGKSDSAISQALEVIRQRSVPALLIVGLDNRLLYVSKDALSMFEDLNDIPAEIRQLCDLVRNRAGLSDASASSAMNCAIFRGAGGILYSMRGFPAADQGNAASHVMVLIEKVAEREPINVRKAKTKYGLSAREIEVVILLAQGFCNKEIGAKLFISEHTVKDHLKNITRKIGADSRGNIVAMLK